MPRPPRASEASNSVCHVNSNLLSTITANFWAKRPVGWAHVHICSPSAWAPPRPAPPRPQSSTSSRDLFHIARYSARYSARLEQSVCSLITCGNRVRRHAVPEQRVNRQPRQRRVVEAQLLKRSQAPRRLVPHHLCHQSRHIHDGSLALDESSQRVSTPSRWASDAERQ